MADHDVGQPRCTGCGAELRPGDAFCGACGTARPVQQIPIEPPGAAPGWGSPGFDTGAVAPAEPTEPMGAPDPGPPPAWGDPGFDTGGFSAPPPASAYGRSVSKTAQAWGAVSLVFGVLVLIGSGIPWFAHSTAAVTDDMRSAWPLIVIGLVGVLGGIDGLRGSMQGPALAAGIGSVFTLLQVILLRILTQSTGVTIGGGGVAWTLAAVAAVLLAIASLSMLRVDREEGTAPGWLGGVVFIAGAAWFVGMVMPATPGVSVGDHVQYGLFGGDTFFDVMTVLLLGIPAVLILVAATTGSRIAHGLAAGTMVFWAVGTVTTAAGAGADGGGQSYVSGGFWPLLLGSLGVAVGGCLAMVLPVVRPLSSTSNQMPLGAGRPVAALAPAVALALLPIAGLVGIAQYADDDGAYKVTASGLPLVPSGTGYGYGSDDQEYDPDIYDEGYDDSYENDVDAGGSGGTGGTGTGGSVDVICTDLVDSTIQSAWQDEVGRIHVIIVVNDDCEVDQLLADSSATFTLTSASASAHAAEATFDFSSQPLFIPAHGSSEAEIVFEPDSFVDLEAVETLGLGDDSSSGAGGLGITYSYTCTNAPDGSTASNGGDPIVGEATGTPVVPEAPTASDALTRLQDIAAADGPYIESDVIDRWVPQISSKKPDVTLPNGSVWDTARILQDHRDWREQFPRVRLLWSGDYSTYSLKDYWVTIVAIPFDTPEGAVGWCDDNGLPAEDCYAKLISHTHPEADSTRNR
jgi:hypothetical protein